MSYNVECSACGHRNALGRLFCAKCGARLSVTEQSVRSSVSAIARFGHWFARVVRLAIFLGFFAALIQLLRPVEPEGVTGNLTDAGELAQKLNLLNVAVLERRGMTQEATEAEVNAYLEQIVKNTPDRTAEGPLKFELQRINVAFRGGELVSVMVSEWGPFALTYEIRSTPAREDDRFTLDVQGLRMGHLPLPQPVARWTAARMARVFGRLEREKRLLDQMQSVEILEDGVVKATTPGV